MTGLVVYGYSFFATLRKMAQNSRMSKLSEKDDECVFSWKLFTAWDYMIGNAETAHNRVASIIMGFKESLLEEAEKKRESRNWKVFCFRLLVNSFVLGLLAFSAFAVIVVVRRSTEEDANSTVWRKNEITVVMSLITLLFPMLFEVLGFLEQYHPRKQLRIQLARIMVLNLLNLYSLIFALFDKISDMTKELQQIKNITNTTDMLITSISKPTIETAIQTFDIISSSSPLDKIGGGGVLTSSNLISAIAHNASLIAATKIARLATELYKNNTESVLNQFINTTQSATAEVTEFTNKFESLPSSDADITHYEYYIDMNDTNETFDSFYATPMYFSNGTTLLYDNESISGNYSNSATFDIDKLTYAFEDYLLFILDKFYSSVNTTENINGTTVLPITNFTIFNTSDENYNIFKSTLEPLFPYSITTESNEKVDEELTTIFEDVTTTLATLLPEVTTKSPIIFVKNCSCNYTTAIPVVSNITTTMPTTLIPLKNHNYSTRARLRSLCWETMFGQELIKLTVMDMLLTVLSTLAIDFFRGIFVRVMNRCWCWDLEKKFPQYGDFKVAENILHLVNNQGMVWMGMFFSPGLVLLNIVKLYILMYLKTWAVLTCNVPHEIIFRASRSNNFYYALLLMMLFLCVLPVGYAIVWVEPSWHCGPFSGYERIIKIFTKTMKAYVPKNLHPGLDYIASPGIVIPLLVLLVLIIYYLVSLTGDLREANNDLKIQLRRERTEERRKMFQMAKRRKGGSGEIVTTPSTKWKKILGSLPAKSFDDTTPTPRQDSEDNAASNKEDKSENKNIEFFSKLFKKALRKVSSSEEDQNQDDGTDTDQHDSLPYDNKEVRPSIHKPVRHSLSSNSGDFYNLVRKLSFQKDKKTDSVEDSVEKKPPFILTRRDTLELKKNTLREKFQQQKMKEKTSASRQDSSSSIWSDNIPVIKISKTESTENILGDKDPKRNNIQGNSEDTNVFKPKIKCALRKQSTEIDEDIICHFGNDIEKLISEQQMIKAVSEECPDDVLTPDQKNEDNLTDKSTSEDTEVKDASVDTIVMSPYHDKSESSDDEAHKNVEEKQPAINAEWTEAENREKVKENDTETESSSSYKE